MSQSLVKVAADFETQLASPVSVADTTATLVSVTDDDGNALANGNYILTVDLNSSSKEYFICTLTGVNLTAISSISRQGVATSGFARAHRRGAKIVLTDWASLGRIVNLLNGTTGFDSGTPLGYDGDPGLASGTNKFATVNYVDGVAIAGGADASTTVKGISKLSTAPASATDPIAAGTNDTRIPTQDENDALVGTSGTPSASNKYVTDDDVSDAGVSGKIVRASGTSLPALDGSNLTGMFNANMTIPLGESFTGATTPQPAVIINDLWQYISTRWCPVGLASTSGDGHFKQAVKFTPRSGITANSIITTLAKSGSPVDNIFITIETDNSGSPSGTPVTNGTSGNVTGGSLSSTAGQLTEFTFSTPFSLTVDTPYWVVFQRSSTASDADFFLVGSALSGTDYASFVGKKENGAASWSTGKIPYFKMTPSSNSGSYSLWQSDSNATVVPMRFYSGMVTTTGSAGDDATIVTAGSLSGFTGLIPYMNYMVSTVKGEILKAGTSGIKIGMATSSTTIFLDGSKKVQGVIPFSAFDAGLSVNDFAGGTIYVPYDGTLIFSNEASGTAVTDFAVTTGDGIAITIDNQTNGIQSSSSIQIKSGDYFAGSKTTAGSITAYYMPNF